MAIKEDIELRLGPLNTCVQVTPGQHFHGIPFVGPDGMRKAVFKWHGKSVGGRRVFEFFMTEKYD